VLVDEAANFTTDDFSLAFCRSAKDRSVARHTVSAEARFISAGELTRNQELDAERSQILRLQVFFREVRFAAIDRFVWHDVSWARTGNE
jgi:hypothetical protein